MVHFRVSHASLDAGGGLVTSGTMRGSRLVLQSCHEEICSRRAVADLVRRPGVCHMAFQQEE